MINSIHPEHTLYTIYFKLEKEIQIQIGRLGLFDFQVGTYIYVGSAKRNIEARIRRHMQQKKKNHWHFDYLRPYGKITKIITYEGNIGECKLREQIMEEEEGTLPIKGFGSSDCKCPSHLIFLRCSND